MSLSHAAMRVVVVEHHPYGGTLRVGSHQVARELLERGHRVIWVSHARSWVHRLFGPPPPPVVRHDDGVVEVIPRTVLPYVRAPLLDSVARGERWLLRDATLEPLAAEIERVGGCDLLWISDFTMLSILDRIEARRVVLRFFDHLDAFRWMPRSVYDLVARYRDRADLAIASSRSLVRRLAERGTETVYVPNGAHLRPDAARRALATPRSNRIVYLGAIERWFDGAAVELWARALPEYRFEIVGPNRAGLDSPLTNLRYPGPVAYQEVPGLLADARFGLIPFVVDELTRGVHPLKMYDYLVFGCPVLSAALPEVQPDDRGIFVYRDPEEGLEILRRQLDREPDRRALQEIAMANDWSRRLRTVFEHLGEPLEAWGFA